ncbi:phytanoyl-CoA dioxygenase family protein [Dinghuibacter silviterrae]|uniref:Ectoine hydroxylase-related dioxygenase (Phytanoyl-CoA dioxygenase family) n=1 Tax=Dinghuibacter silviterrae TaxID=1539049 RepID=A0A4R8DNC9_9BACT|nr:phytanoyl-CoA dioxygenase family protein [Dinghuibacter silviterrae]TDW99215.1 ectoine hydroxylase-related dioxygenase (phytanoyl-CoA dioxygenase family) [Dinghuibacter silviterrae]
MTTTVDILKELDEPYALTEEQVSFFRENGFIKLKHVLSPEAIDYMDDTITREVHRLNTQHLPLDERDTYGKAFLQIMNIWTQSGPVREIVFSERLAKLASDLLELQGVRLYHDQALYKEAGGGITPWHADQYYWPLATDRTVTVWIPLQETPLELGPLEFSAGSHRMRKGRDLEISDESQDTLEFALKQEGFRHVIEPFDLGEVSFHTGWLYHRAGANRTDRMRKVMTMIYMDKDMVLKEPWNEHQVTDWNSWCPGAKVGEVIRTPRNPLLYEAS